MQGPDGMINIGAVAYVQGCITVQSEGKVGNSCFSPSQNNCLPRKDLDHSISSRADHIPAVLAPDHTAYSFTAHWPVARDILCAYSFVKRPEAYAGIVTGRHSLVSVLR